MRVGVPGPHPTAPVLAAIALFAGILQVMATVMLGLAPLEHLRAAASEGAHNYLLGTLGAMLGLIAVWMMRRHPLRAAVVLVLWQAAVFWPLHARTSLLGLAFHGEYILHHFTGLLAAAVCVAIASGWIRRPNLGVLRLIPAGLALLGTLALVAAHVLEQPSVSGRTVPWLEHGGAGLLLLAWATALVAMWRRLGPARLRVAAAVLLLPFLMRVALAWPEGLAGASVPDTGRPMVMLTMVVAAVTTFVAFQPSVSSGVRPLVMVFSGLASLVLSWFYWRGFGELEAGLGGLAQSMFAFSLPYPKYVALWEVVVVILGLFAMFSSAYAGLVSPGQRTRGLALALLLVTGLGLSTPPLVLLTGAAALLWIDSLSGGAAAPVARAASAPMKVILERFAERLELPGVVALEDSGRTLLAVRGEVNDTPVDLRARPVPGDHWDVVVAVGTLGRGRPPLGLVPEPGNEGHRPAHPLARSHRAHGQVRRLELLDDALFDALVPFPQSRVALWDAGTRVRLGADLSALDDEGLTAMVRQLATRE